MRAATLLLILIPSVFGTATAIRDVCNDDRCYSGAIVRQGPTGRASCSSFLSCTVTPPTSTVSTTVTITPAPSTRTVTNGATPLYRGVSSALDRVKRVVVVGVVPHLAGPVGAVGQIDGLATSSYHLGPQILAMAPATTHCPSILPTGPAAMCRVSSMYSSACSCAGITNAYTTVPTPTSTHKVTVTVAPVVHTVTVQANGTSTRSAGR